MRTEPLTETEKEILADFRQKDEAAKLAWKRVLEAGLYLESIWPPSDLRSDWRNPPSVTEAGARFWHLQGQTQPHPGGKTRSADPPSNNGKRKKIEPEIDLTDDF